MKDKKELFALTQLFNIKNIPKEAFSALPDNVRINNVIIINGNAEIDISKDFISKVSNHNILMILDQITKTIFQFDYISTITFKFDGETVAFINGWVFNEPILRKTNMSYTNDALKQFKLNLKGKTKDEIFNMLKTNADTLKTVNSTYPKIVYLDAGHGGSDPGAVATLNGVEYHEKDLNLAITNAVKSKLEEYDYTVYMRRDDDTYTDFNQIDDLANQTDATCFVSIHCNAAGTANPNGTEVYYPQYNPSGCYPDRTSQSTDLADLCGHYLDMWNLPYWGTNPKEGNYHVLNNTKMYACLVECGFMTNEDDLEYLIDTANQADIGENIALGILYWFYFNGWH